MAVSLLLAPRAPSAQTAPLDSMPLLLDSKSASKLAVRQVPPQYPPLAKYNFIQGRVSIQLLVTDKGQVREAHVVRGHPFLAASALQAIRHWKYRPFMTRSGPAKFRTIVEVNFALRIKKIDLTPRQPEQDLNRQIRPPELIHKPQRQSGSASVRLRVLLDDKGRVLDSQPMAGQSSDFETARQDVEQWTFRPARWGSFNVPWYLDVDVPIKNSALHEGAGDPGGE